MRATLLLLCCLGLLSWVSGASARVRAAQRGDDLVLSGPAGTRIAVLDQEEKRVGAGRIGAGGTLRLRGAGQTDPMLMIVVVDGERRPLSDLFEPVELLTVLPQRVSAGLPIVPHVRVLRRAGGKPAAGIGVAVGLACGGDVRWLGQLETSADGVAQPGAAPLTVPADLSGECRLTVRAEGARVTEEVTVQRGVRVMVSTDRPAYEPGDVVHGRALVLDEATSRPAAGVKGHFELAAPRGRVLARQPATTSRFGVANQTLTIPTDGAPPDVEVRFIADGARGEAPVRVGRYVPERVTVLAATDVAAVRAGATFAIDVSLQRLDGGPVEGSRIEAVGRVGDREVFRHHATAGAAGARIGATVPGDVSGPLAVAVRAETPGGEVGRTHIEVPVDDGRLALFVIPESGDAPGGLRSGVWIVAQRPDGTPAQADLEVRAGDAQAAGRTGGDGVAFVTLPLPRRGGEIEVVASENGREGRRSVPVTPISDRSALLSVPSALVRAGDTLEVTYRAATKTGTGVIEVVREGHAITSAPFRLAGGEGRAAVRIPEGTAGALLLHAWHLTEGGQVAGDTRLVVAQAAGDLDVRITSDRESYRPREEARLDVSVTDVGGRPVVAAVGITVVDAGLRALGLQQPGVERALARLGGRWDDHEASLPGWARSALYEAGDARRLSVLASAVEAAVALLPPAETAARRRSEALLAWQLRIDSRAEVLAGRLTRFFAAVKSARDKPLDWDRLRRHRAVRPADLRDPWGRPLRAKLLLEQACCASWIEVTSPGLDGRPGTGDDLQSRAEVDHYYADCTAHCAFGIGLAGLGAGGGGAAFARHLGRVVAMATAVPERPLRTDFPDTLAVVSALITGPDGKATWTVRLADSLTRWLVQARAVSQSGGLGAAEHELQVEQPFSVDVALPPALTLGDRMELPLAVTNRTGQPQRVVVTGRAGGSLTAGLDETLEVPSGATRAVAVTVEAAGVGEGWIELRAAGGGLSDGIRRAVLVEPDGVPVEAARAGVVTARAPATASLAVPAEGIPGTTRVTLRLYPSAVGQVIEGLEDLLGVPSGCFEQMSATTYPNALVMGYLRETGQSSPTVALRAKGLLRSGYKGLASYEVEGGGFSWFGDAPANQVLTAFGLMEFERMASLVKVDRPMIARTRRWLLGQRKDDGSFAPDASYLHAESWKAIQNAALPVTAYVTWALLRAGAGEDAAPSVAWLEANAADAGTNYEKALVALALSASGADTAGPARARLVAAATTREKECFWAADGPTNTFAQGDSAAVESTALAAMALLEGGDHPDVLARTMRWLSARRRPGGGWGTTQATVLALEALLRHEAAGREPARGTVSIVADGEEVATERLTEHDFDVVRSVALPASPGERRVELRLAGQGAITYQLASVQHRRLEAFPAVERPLALTVDAGTRNLEVGQRARLTVSLRAVAGEVRMPTVEIGLPAGFDVDHRAISDPRIKRVEVLGRRLVLYLTELPGGAELTASVEVTARRAGTLSPGPARAWPYYQPEQTTWISQPAFTVSAQP